MFEQRKRGGDYLLMNAAIAILREERFVIFTLFQNCKAP